MKKSFLFPIVSCSDGNFKNHFLVTAISIVKNNLEHSFKFHLLCSEFDPEWNNKAQKCIEDLGSSFEVIKVDEGNFRDFPLMHDFPVATYYRLFIPQIIHDSKYLYVDADIVCNNPIESFLDIDLEGKLLAAVEDSVFTWKSDLGMSSDSKYFNSGVLLVDSDKWKELEIGKKVIDFLFQCPNKLRFADQCGLNAILDGEWKQLSQKFNQQAIIYREDFSFEKVNISQFEIQEAKNEPVFIHYTGKNKPWQYNCPHPLKHIYWEYQKFSPFKLKFPLGMKWYDHVKILVPKSFKSKIKNQFKLRF